MGDGTIIDSMIHDGLWDSFHNIHMGLTGEHVSEKYNVTREEQDRYAADSHRKAAHATRAGLVHGRNPARSRFRRRRATRSSSTATNRFARTRRAESLARLKPAFKKDGTVTAGNAPGVNDGAAALVVMGADVAARLNLKPLARVVGYATAGLEPKLVMMTPVEAVRKLNAEDRLEDRRRGARRAERSVLRAGRRGHARARPRSGARERAGRRRRARPPDRRERRAHSDDAALRAEAPGQEARHRDAVPRRRQRRGHGGE